MNEQYNYKIQLNSLDIGKLYKETPRNCCFQSTFQHIEHCEEIKLAEKSNPTIPRILSTQ